MEELLFQIACATGLPTDLVMGELKKLILQAGKKVEDLTLDELRDILASFTQDVLLEAQSELN